MWMNILHHAVNENEANLFPAPFWLCMLSAQRETHIGAAVFEICCVRRFCCCFCLRFGEKKLYHCFIFLPALNGDCWLCEHGCSEAVEKSLIKWCNPYYMGYFWLYTPQEWKLHSLELRGGTEHTFHQHNIAFSTFKCRMTSVNNPYAFHFFSSSNL